MLIRYVALFLSAVLPAAAQSTPPVNSRADVYNAQFYGWLPDGTDRSTKATALINLVAANGGGTIFFPAAEGAYRADSQIQIPNNSAAPWSFQSDIRLVGAGGGVNWFSSASNIPNASILDLRYSGPGGKINTNGGGALGIENLTFEDLGNDSTPFIYTTSTTLTIRDTNFIGTGSTTQDAIVLGGAGSTVDNTDNSAFQGYGTIIEHNLFTKLNRGVYGRTYANSVIVSSNSWAHNTGTRAIEFDASGNSTSGDFGLDIRDNIIEMDVYTYGLVLNYVKHSVVSGNGFYDPGSNHLFDIFFVNAVIYNTFYLGHHETNQIFGGDATSLLYNSVFSSLQGVKLTPGTFTAAPLNIPPGSAPTSPKDGDIWYDAMDRTMKIRINGTTKTFAFQ